MTMALHFGLRRASHHFSSLLKRPSLVAISAPSVRFASTLPSEASPSKLMDSLPPTNGDLSAPPPVVPDNLFESLAPSAFEGGLPKLEALTSIGQMRDIYGLCSNWTPAGWVQSAMEILHVGVGLPWWGTIFGATLLARVLLLPAFIKSQKAMAKMQELKPQTDKMAEAKKAYAKVGDKMGEQREAQKVMLLYKERGVNPFSAIGWGFLPAVVLISFFFAIRGIVDANVPGLGTQGILWVKDLTVTDETYIMPVLSMIGFLGAYSAGLKTQTAAPNGMISKLVVPLSVVGLIASSWFPAALFFYAVPSIFFSLLQSLLFQIPAFRGWVGLKPLSALSAPINDAGSIAAVRQLTLREAHKKMKRFEAASNSQ